VVPRPAARRSRVVPQSKQLAARRGNVEQSEQLGKQPDEAMPSSRGGARADKRARTGRAPRWVPPAPSRRCREKNVFIKLAFAYEATTQCSRTEY
jgi:hypothetical protein